MSRMPTRSKRRLQLKEKHGGEVIVLCAGLRAPRRPFARRSPRARTARFTSKPTIAQRTRSAGLARTAGRGVEAEKPDLVFTGLQSDDLGYGQTGVILAEVLGLPHATIIMKVETTERGIRVKRELEDGWFQHVEMPLPAC